MNLDDKNLEAWTPELRVWLDCSARNAGFEAAGVAAMSDPGSDAAAQQASRFDAWIEAGYAGDMDYLKRRDQAGRLVRGEVQAVMPWARSAIVCALNYNADAPRSIDPAKGGTGWIARYAWSGRTLEDGTQTATDYHDELITRLRKIEAGLQAQATCSTRCYVDTGPLLERNLAERAAVGWIGKNTCMLNQQLGSWLLLGVIVTSLRAADEAMAVLPEQDRCGTCSRCIDACPTGALLGSKDPAAPRAMDASRCIAYLTIEKKRGIDESLREQMGRQVFGCDICQDVCPWNRKAPIGGHEGMAPRAELINPALEWLADMDAREFRRRFKGSPLERTGRKRLLRNVAIAMGNSGNERFLPILEKWAASGSAVGSSLPAHSNDEALREAAEWARRRIGDVL